MASRTPKDSHIGGDHVEKKKTVPKFASFRPKNVPLIGKGERQSKPEYGPLSWFAEDDQRHVGKNIGGAQEYLELSRAIDPKNSSASYAIDRLGDPDILTFGSLHLYGTPSYSRFGAGNVIGSHEGIIDKASSAEKYLILNDRRRRWSKGHDRRTIWRHRINEDEQLRVKAPAGGPSAMDMAQDFVSFTSAKRRRMNDGSSLEISASSDEEDTHYRSVEGKAQLRHAPEDEDLQFTDASGTKDRSIDQLSWESKIQKDRVALAREVDAEPTSHTAWLNLIKHQDSVVWADGRHNKTRLTQAEQRSNAEIKLSMYEKALEKVKDLDGREALLLGKMEEGPRIWDSSRSLSEWQSVLRSNPLHLELWIRYLDFRQTTFVLFQYEEVHSVYIDSLTTLKGIMHSASKPLEGQEKVFEIQIYLLLRITLFMRESGFQEQAVATWQALLEYSMFKPYHLEQTEYKEGGSLHHKALTSFEEFWDSEAPRIGEEGCEGWACSRRGQGEAPESRRELPDAPDLSHDLWSAWLELQHRQDQGTQLPARTTDDVVENDPYRVILYSDIRPFLIEPPTISSRSTVLDAFLAFCHLPPLPGNRVDGSSRFWWRSGYLHSGIQLVSFNIQLNKDSKILRKDEQAQDAGSSPLASGNDPFHLPVIDYQVSSDSLMCQTGSWFSVLDAWDLEHCNDQGLMQRNWILRSLKSLVFAGIGGDQLAEYLLGIELRCSPETVRKTAKSLLKKQPSDLCLYGAYALLECRLGNPAKGESAIMAAIDMSKKLDESNARDALFLWRIWAWELLSQGNRREALEWLLMFGNDSSPSTKQNVKPPNDSEIKPALMLRATSALIASRDYCTSARSPKHAALAAECLILIDYLKSPQSLSAATTSFKSNIDAVFGKSPERTSVLELLHQSFVRLLYHHITHTHLVKPSEIRSLLTESISLFPHNTIFLSLYAWNEARFRLDDRVRSIVKDVALSESTKSIAGSRQDNVIPHFFAIYNELRRSTTLGGNVSTIRSTIERAVGGVSGAHCAGLWKLYFLFEYHRGDKVKSKNIFWRGVKACPWVKELYLFGFEYPRGEGGFTDEELRSIYELMVEKGIRIHGYIEEALEAMDDAKAIGQT